MADREKVGKLLETVRCVGIIGGVSAEVMVVVGLTTSSWLDFSYDEAHAGLFQYCHTNETVSGKTKPDGNHEFCVSPEDMPGGVSGFLHVCRALLIMAVIICGLCTFCGGTFRCRMDGKRFRERHVGEMFILLASTFTFTAAWVFQNHYTVMPLFQQGRLGMSHVVTQIASLMLAAAVVLMISPTLYEKWETWRGCNSSPSRNSSPSPAEARAAPANHYTVRRRQSTSSASTDQPPPSYSEVTGGLVDRLRLAMSHIGMSASRDTNQQRTSSALTHSTTDISIITVEQTRISSFPSVTDILSLARARNAGGDTSSNDITSPVMPPPPSYDSLDNTPPGGTLPPPPSYDNAIILESNQTSEVLPPSYAETVSTENNTSQV